MPFTSREERNAYHRERYQKTKAVKWRDEGDMRTCTVCKQAKPRATAFPKLKIGRLGHAAQCKACKNKYRRGSAPAWTGLTRAQYQKHVREGLCHICNKNKKGMALDHCHKTLEKRGVLCMDCNTGLGRFKDAPALLDAAAAYLRK